MNGLSEQLRRHSVALISLAVAVSSLSYNTWRNEQTEANRNIRAAGFELLIKLGELERVRFFSHYDRDPAMGNPRTGWAYVLTIRDLGKLLPEPARSSTGELVAIWNDNWSGLGASDDSAEKVSAAIDSCRDDVLMALAALD
ncbi:MAG: hypothetical protein OEW68_11520 [Gammaproteobacteria bacterium]|nr:hypothetical protein [Gammaproteobacteria bacterium]MDH4315462.1 hypothetical protein [Gammaproteobacteria bacterium]MDH5214279.1 hypothetical protein [Gammaproteobacteria bacterium]MDH5500711.1 hypothetical protein [Gammaproteobacteria bacterium]